jgi:hypothetical protein
MNTNLLDKHPPKFKNHAEELDYCQDLMTECGVEQDAWIGQGTRVSDRLTWLLRNWKARRQAAKP